jgi:hypothetical protein
VVVVVVTVVAAAVVVNKAAQQRLVGTASHQHEDSLMAHQPFGAGQPAEQPG